MSRADSLISYSYKISVVGVFDDSYNRYFVERDIFEGIVAGGECAELKSIALRIDHCAIGGDRLVINIVAPLQAPLLVADAYPFEEKR